MHSRSLTKLSVRVALAGAATFAIAVGASACGEDSSSLSEVAQRGKETSSNKGCAGCHGADGQGGVGPTWIDLAGSEVTLKDGSTLTADDDYLLRAILDPGAEEVAGYTLKMPAPNGVTPEEAADIVAYIKELTTDAES